MSKNEYFFGSGARGRFMDKAEEIHGKGVTSKSSSIHGRTDFFNSKGDHIGFHEIDGEGDQTFNLFKKKVNESKTTCNLYERYKSLSEETTVGVYHGDSRKAVVKKTGTGRHWVMMFRNGKRSPDEDYTTAKDENDAHDFAQSEMRIPSRKSRNMSESIKDEIRKSRARYDKTLGNYEIKDDMVGSARVTKDPLVRVTYDYYGSNKEVPLYTKHHDVRTTDKDEAIKLIKGLVGGSNHRAEIINETSEEINERINKPQGHENTDDKISDDSKKNRGKVKKMMGNRAPMELIARIIAKRIRE